MVFVYMMSRRLFLNFRDFWDLVIFSISSVYPYSWYFRCFCWKGHEKYVDSSCQILFCPMGACFMHILYAIWIPYLHKLCRNSTEHKEDKKANRIHRARLQPYMRSYIISYVISYDIIYEIIYDIIYDIIYEIIYDMIYDIIHDIICDLIYCIIYDIIYDIIYE